MELNKNMFYTSVSGSYVAEEKWRKVRPKESSEYLNNPHKGLQTFQHFNGDPLFPGKTWKEEGPHTFEFVKKTPLTVEGHLPSSVCYNRWNWRTFEPEEGKFDFSVIENSLKVCRLRGQSLHIRMMAFSGGKECRLPDWYVNLDRTVKDYGNGYVEPDHNGKLYLKYWGRLIDKVCKKYGKNPLIDIIDTALTGPCGEGAGNTTAARAKSFVDIYLKNVPPSKLVVDVGQEFPYGVKKGTGFRANCFGDMRNYGHGVVPNGLGWNHHYDQYPKRIIEAGAAETWKHSLVVFETCWTPLEWYESRMPLEFLDFVLQQGLKFHCSLFMPKYSLLPKAYREKLMNFMKYLGYRFVPRYFKYESRINKDGKIKYELWLENTGVAPIYRELYALAFRFTRGRRKVIVHSKQDLRNWLPGDTWISETLTLPAGFENRKAVVEVALVRKETDLPAVKFAVEGIKADGWYRL